MGGKKGRSRQMLAQQQSQQADTQAARQQEDDRQARINQSMSNIAGKFSGYNDDYYNKYKQGVLDYYTPQVADQYKKAQDQTLYALARSGALGSSTQATETANLAKQNDIAMGNVRNKADQEAANQRANIAGQRSKIEAQASTAEDPSIAESQAVNATKNINLDQPDNSALGNVFTLATIGTANALKGYQNQNLYNSFSSPSGGAAATSSGRPIG
jgi:hypothetical protein